MYFAANLSMLYSGLSVADRFAAAADDGFRYVEILAPYDESPDWYAQQLTHHDLQLVLINTPAVLPDYPVGVAAQPNGRKQFQDAMMQAATVCAATGCSAVHVMAGKTDSRYSRHEQSIILHDNLLWASARYPGLTLHLEALNKTDMPDYFYSLPEHVAQELATVGNARIGMQFDVYHVVKEGLPIVDQLDRYFSWVRHVQVAGAPGRHEPDLTQHDLLAGFEHLHALGYAGYVGLEYRPARTTSQGLAWLDPLLDKGLVRK